MTAPTRTRQPAPMDARIRDRRRAVAAARARRRRQVSASILALVVLAVGAVVVARSPLFAITDVRVTGVDADRADEVREAAALRPGASLLFADLLTAAERVEALPWVRRARAGRAPPSTVDIHVVPREPAVVVRLEREAWQVDGDGVVVAGGDAPGLAEIIAPDAVLPGVGREVADGVVRAALQVHTQLPAWLRSSGDRYEARTPRDVRLHLRDGTVVRFGSPEDLAGKVRSVELLLGQLDGRDHHGESSAVLDVRVPGTPVLVPDGGTTGAAVP